MKVTRHQLRKIIREAFDYNDAEYDNELAQALYEAGKLDAQNGMPPRYEANDDYAAGYEDGVAASEYATAEKRYVREARIIDLLREGNSTDPRGLKALLASLNVKGRDFRPVANALSTAYHDFEGGPQDMKDEVETNSGGLPTSTGDWIDWPLATYQEIWNLYEKARLSYRSPQASGPRF